MFYACYHGMAGVSPGTPGVRRGYPGVSRGSLYIWNSLALHHLPLAIRWPCSIAMLARFFSSAVTLTMPASFDLNPMAYLDVKAIRKTTSRPIHGQIDTPEERFQLADSHFPALGSIFWNPISRKLSPGQENGPEQA